MHAYAQIQGGVVMEIIQPLTALDGTEIPIGQRFTPEFVATLVDVTNISPMPACWWTATEANGSWEFTAPS